MNSMRDYPRVWLTRDRREGELLDMVEVWAVPPIRHRSDDGDVLWLPPDCYLLGEIRGETHVTDLTLDEARDFAGTIPETDRECIRVGPDVGSDEIARA